ncbi:hypothetical protein D3C72_2579410 [compost metagenome]
MIGLAARACAFGMTTTVSTVAKLRTLIEGSSNGSEAMPISKGWKDIQLPIALRLTISTV